MGMGDANQVCAPVFFALALIGCWTILFRHMLKGGMDGPRIALLIGVGFTMALATGTVACLGCATHVPGSEIEILGLPDGANDAVYSHAGMGVVVLGIMTLAIGLVLVLWMALSKWGCLKGAKGMY